MRNSKRSISSLLKSGSKRFKDLSYDLLEDGEALARGRNEARSSDDDDRELKEKRPDFEEPTRAGASTDRVVAKSAASAESATRSYRRSRGDSRAPADATSATRAKTATVAKSATTSGKQVVAKSDTSAERATTSDSTANDPVADIATVAKVATGLDDTDPVDPALDSAEPFLVAESATIAVSATRDDLARPILSATRTVGQPPVVAKADTVAETAAVAETATPVEHESTASRSDGRFVTLPLHLIQRLRDEDLSPRETRILFAIVFECLASGRGYAEMSGNDLQNRTQIHRTHTFAAVKTLIERQLIVKEKQESAGKNVFRLCPESFHGWRLS